MKATETLKSEHRVIESVIGALEIGVQKLEQGVEIRSSFFLDVVDFIKGFADAYHHRREEDILFKAMAKFGVPEEGSPVGVMLAEHQQGRAYTAALGEAAQLNHEGNTSANSKLVHNALSYAALLRQHILKEDNILYAIANEVIPISYQHQLDSQFEEIENVESQKKARTKYLLLAEKLVSETQS